MVLLVLPVLGVLALVRRYLPTYAPTNVLSGKARGSVPNVHTAMGLLILAVLLLAWDTITIGRLGTYMAVRFLPCAGRRVAGRRGAGGIPRLV